MVAPQQRTILGKGVDPTKVAEVVVEEIYDPH